ncbi:MAG: PDR/VanB family oxidoreductase [Candidatus Thiodiazotropha sp.]
MIEVIVTAKQREAEDIYTFELARPDQLDLPAFDPGAHIDVHLPNGMVRQYSLCNHPAETNRYLIGVLKDPASRGGSFALHEQVFEGDRLQISEPRNLFPLAEKAKRSLLLAGGIGVTPILCMAQTLASAGEEFEMHYCARSRNRMAFMRQIAESDFADHVYLHFDDEAPEQQFEADKVLANPAPGTNLYVCGPAGFLDHVLQRASAHGWPAEQVHREYFAASPADHTDDAGFEIEIKSSGQVLVVPADRSALEVLEEAGIFIPVSCEEGVCGTCMTRVLKGEPEHRDLFMTEQERALNNQFTPCCSRAKSGRLVLDL